LVANYVRTDIAVEFQSENGVLAWDLSFEGEEDADIINTESKPLLLYQGILLTLP
jgi:3-oxoacid CoA-transferase subunit B